MMKVERVRELVVDAAVYCPNDEESMRVDYYDHDSECFWATGEESGESYCIDYNTVGDHDSFYKLVLMNP